MHTCIHTCSMSNAPVAYECSQEWLVQYISSAKLISQESLGATSSTPSSMHLMHGFQTYIFIYTRIYPYIQQVCNIGSIACITRYAHTYAYVNVYMDIYIDVYLIIYRIISPAKGWRFGAFGGAGSGIWDLGFE